MAGKITDYFTIGSAVPSGAPSVPSGEVALYLRTGTNHLYAWDGSAWQDTTAGSGMTNPMTTAGDIIVGGSSGTPTRLAKGADSTVLTIDPSTHLPVYAVSGGGGGGNTLIAAVAGTDGATATVGSSYVALSTPWITGTLVTTATQDILIDVQVAYLLNQNTDMYFAIMRSGTQIFNTAGLYNGENPTTQVVSHHFGWVDKALAAGSYTYEVRVGNIGSSTTFTLKNAVVTSPTALGKAGSMMMVTSAPNV